MTSHDFALTKVIHAAWAWCILKKGRRIGAVMELVLVALLLTMMMFAVLARGALARRQSARVAAKAAAVATLAALALGGCGSDGKETAALALTPVPTGKARIILTRVSAIVYSGCPATIMRGAEKAADIANGGQAIIDVPAGENTLTASCWSYPGNFTVKFKAAAGQKYAFEVAPRDGSIGTAVLFGAIGGAIDASVNENSGAFQIGANKSATTAAASPAAAPSAAAPAAKALAPASAPTTGKAPMVKAKGT